MKTMSGHITLPSESHFLKETKEILEKLGADAIRDSDGTKLSDDVKQLDAKIYTTYFVSRGHNEFAQQHMDECQQFYLMSNYTLATSDTVEIPIMDGYFKQQVNPCTRYDMKRYWEVRDRTTGLVVDGTKWQYQDSIVRVHDIEPWHEYTVSFLADAIWDPTQMYNHITNDWQDKPHEIPFDVRKPHASQYVEDYLKQWLAENTLTDVVRFTTFFYHFTLVFNDLGKEKFVDWFGYSASVSVDALEAFQKEYGYALTPEDFVDQGYYNTAFRVPSKAFLDFIDFQQRFVCEKAKRLVDLVHASGKEAMMFLGDNWIGTEPYGAYFPSIGLDAVVGSVGSGATLRMISEIPGVSYTEGRFLPYFFPDVFREGNDPCIEANENWLAARRAMLRKPLHRMGYGGYLSLAYQFPAFMDRVAAICDEFRTIRSNILGIQPYSELKVGILNAWGKLRSWQTHMVAHALWYKQIYSYLGILEALSGMKVEVCFLSFDEIKTSGIPEDVDVIINAGDAGTAFSGGTHWKDDSLVSVIRQWIYQGGGFIGVGEPGAIDHQGHYFQLASALGVEKELGFSLSTDKYFNTAASSHFITEDNLSWNFGESMHNVYAVSALTQILEYSNGEIHASANTYGLGRCVYLAGLPYSHENTRILLRALYFAAGKEAAFYTWHCSNVFCEIHAYPDTQKFAVVNNTDKPQQTIVYQTKEVFFTVDLAPCEIRWMEY